MIKIQKPNPCCTEMNVTLYKRHLLIPCVKQVFMCLLPKSTVMLNKNGCIHRFTVYQSKNTYTSS